MGRRQAGILIGLLLVGVLSLAYGTQVLADLELNDPATDVGDVFTTKLILSLDTPGASSPEADLLEARPVIARRLDKLNLNGPYNLAIRHGQLEVTLPKAKNTPYIASSLTSSGEIVFIDGGAEAPPVGQQIKTGLSFEPGQNAYPILFTSREVSEIVPPDSTSGRIFYSLTLQPSAVDRLAAFVKAQPDSYICMVMDEQVLNCSTMYHQTENVVEFLPELSSGSAITMADLAVFLHSGPLSTRLRVVSN
jgi:hypothetical protein